MGFAYAFHLDSFHIFHSILFNSIRRDPIELGSILSVNASHFVAKMSSRAALTTKSQAAHSTISAARGRAEIALVKSIGRLMIQIII